MLLVQAIFITVISIPFVIFIRTAPDLPPSLVATKDPEERHVCQTIGKAFSDRNFNILLVIFTLVDGVFISFGACLSTIFTPLGFSSSQCSFLGAGTVIFGVSASFAAGFTLKKTKKNRLLLRISCVGSSIMLIVGIFVLRSEITWLIYINIFVAGSLIVPIIPISLNFASELTFPQAPAVITGFVLMAGCVGGFILAIVNSILAVKNPIYAITLMAALTSIASILSIFIQEDLKRYKFS